jgi:hypothetical protein
MNIYGFIKDFLSYFFTSGIIISLSLVILKSISQYHNLVGFFAFVSASFFIVNLIQFYVINKENKDANLTFLLHTIVGGIIWVIYSIIMFFLYLNNLSIFNIIFILVTIVISITSIYFYLTYNKIFNF